MTKLVRIKKAGEKQMLDIHPDALEQHKKLGWVEHVDHVEPKEVEKEASEEQTEDADESEGEVNAETVANQKSAKKGKK